MKVIKSIVTTDAILTYSNVEENEHPQWQSGTSYQAFDRIIYNHKIYEAILENSSQTPPNLDLVNWRFVESTNQYKMFNNVLSDKTTKQGGIHFTIKPNQIVTGLAMIGVEASSVRLVVTDPVLGIIYDETKYLYDVTNVETYFQYFYQPVVVGSSSVAFLSLPIAPTATIDVYIDSADAEVSVAEVVFGSFMNVGNTNYGTSIGLKSFSRKEVDEFGNVTVIKRRNSKYCEYDITIENTRLAAVQKFFGEIDSVPCLFVGNEDLEELIVYGFYSDFRATISYPQISKCTLRVEGLV